MLDLCSGDSFVLNYVGDYIDEYIGVDNNEKYLSKLKSKWPNFKFINSNISGLDSLSILNNYKPDIIFMNGAIHHLDNDIMNSINLFISKFEKTIFLSVDPIKYKNKLLNKIMIFLDRGVPSTHVVCYDTVGVRSPWKVYNNPNLEIKELCR